MPAALTIICALYSAVSPVLWSRTFTPVILSCSRRNSVTSVYTRTSAPWSLASTTFEEHSLNGSTDPSGTLTAPMMSGLTDGSSRMASFGSITSALIPALVHDSTNLAWYARSSSGNVMKNPDVSSTQWLAIFLRIMFSWMHSAADSWSVTAYLAPLWSRPWFRPVAPSAMSWRSISSTLRPLNEQSRAVPAPVMLPPMTMTSNSFFCVPDIAI